MTEKRLMFRRDAEDPHDDVDGLPDPPPWRRFTDEAQEERGRKFVISEEEEEMVNAALYLRRPLLVTGKPGTGKSSLAYAVATQLGLGKVLVWPITRSTLQQGLYSYDAVGRLQDASVAKQAEGSDGGSTNEAATAALPAIGKYIKLGPLGTAMLPGVKAEGKRARPRSAHR